MIKNYNNLIEVFNTLQKETKTFTASQNGKAFDNSLKIYLEKFGINEIPSAKKYDYIFNIEKDSNENLESKNEIQNKWKKIKESIINKKSIEITKNPFKIINSNFMFQPFGKQNFPDFIVFINKHIIAIEIKFSTKTFKSSKDAEIAKPMWNSNFPKQNAIYIFGVKGYKTTFF